MEPVPAWSPETVSTYLRGLDPSLQLYPFQEWGVTGQELLGLSPQQLGLLEVRSIGHQELILEAVEQLCALHYELHSESLRSLTEKLWGVSQMLRSQIVSRRKLSFCAPEPALSPTPKQLVCIIDIVSAARGLFSWLNRYLFACLNDYSASRDVIALCVELAETLHKDWSDPQIEDRISSICRNICGICENILSCSPESLLSQTATLEHVRIQHDLTQDSLGIVIRSTSSGQHFIYGTAAESPAGRCGRILPGDEIIQVNDQVVVGWTRLNLVRKLQEKSDCVTVILKKVSIPAPPSPVTPTSPTSLITPIRQTPCRTPISPTAHSAPTSPTGHGSPTSLTISDTPAYPTKNCSPIYQKQRSSSSSPPTLRGASSSPPTMSSASSPPTLRGASSSPTSHRTCTFWTYPGSPSYHKPHLTSIFPTSPISPSPTSPDPSSPAVLGTFHALPPCAGFSTSRAQPEWPVTLGPQEISSLQYDSCPRSSSDTISSPPASLFSVPVSVDVLHPALSGSLVVPPQSVLHREEASSGSPAPGVEPQPSAHVRCSPNSTHSPKKLQPPDTRNQKSRSKEESARTPRNKKGVATRLSRRRVSCRDLGTPDCNGWLWKKKEHVGFMSQRWKRCWCVLKGERLYWYNAPQDEKALGLVNMSSYNLEGTRDPKKKYEFQLSLHTYKPFVFAADNLSDMSKWVTVLCKFKAPPPARHPREEDCYSETEAEDQDEDPPRAQDPREMQTVQPQTKNVSGAESPTSRKEREATGGGQSPGASNAQPEGDSLESLISCLKQGGVSLIGKKTPLTHDEYRKSFIRRNNNPDINRRAHTLRTLHSTLKAKLSELQALNQILENPNINSAIFQRWKAEHGQLYGSPGQERRGREESVGKEEKGGESATSD